MNLHREKDKTIMNWYTIPKLEAALVLLVAVACLTSACEYDPPPAVLNSQPDVGSATNDMSASIVVHFTEPINRESLEVTFSSRKLDEEGHLLPWCESGQTKKCNTLLAGPCTPRGECPGAIMILNNDFTEMTFDPDEDLRIGEYLLRISAGLEDMDGNSTEVPYDVFFFASPTGTVGPTTFQPGVFISWLDLDKPFKFPLEVYWHIRVDPDTGSIYGGGCDGDLIDPDGERIFDHELWKPVPYLEDDGFKFVFSGLAQDAQIQDEEGDLHDGHSLITSPFYIYCAQPEVEVMDGSIVVSVVHDEDLGREVMRGMLNSDETYIFDTPEHSHPNEASGVLYGYRLIGDEIGPGKAWEDCADDETVTRPGL